MSQLNPSPVPIRGLYSPAELFTEFEPAAVGSYVHTLDARTYLDTRRDWSDQAGLERAVHDHLITIARDDFIDGRPVVAIMGGHKEARGSTTYRMVANLANRLAERFVLASGGGPGAMEATHLGALIADVAQLDAAITHLGTAAAFPDGMHHLITGSSFDHDLVATLHRWQAPAFEVLAGVPTDHRRASLSIPTWFYGHEPPTPFATHIAKYFHNAIREDGLLAIADHGIIYSPGKAGTLQEVFQDAAQNYYESFGRFSPMVFLDINGWWTEQFPVERLLRPLFGDERFDRWVLITPDPTAAFDWLVEHQDLGH
jgi:predicted Rossmann-fold nucleotide-binding protein